MTTGSLAGHNAVRNQLGMPLLTLPRNLVVGDLIVYALVSFLAFSLYKYKYKFIL